MGGLIFYVNISGLRKGANNHEEIWLSQNKYKRTDTVMWGKDLYLDRPQKSIWRNNKGNVYLLDCGCGFGSGKLAGICIETGERFYSQKEQ